MSKLYATESGRVVRALGEELTRFRRARKVLSLPETSEPAHLFVLARAHEPEPGPLHVSINGHAAVSVEANTPGTWHWIEINVPPDQLVAGDNNVEFRADSTAMTSWALAMEPGHADPGSFVSDNIGTTWRNEHMSYLNAVRGEYIVRVRLAEGQDPAAPELIHEELNHPKSLALRATLPVDAIKDASLYDRVRAISAWIARTFEHRNSNRASYYAPWDTETIRAWGAAGIGHAGQPTVTMCSHYAAAFVSTCQATGIAARCAITTEAVDGGNGHFVAEVWFPDLEKWVLVDPNVDYVVRDGDNPLSLPEVRDLGPRIKEFIDFGAGTDYQQEFSHMAGFIDNLLEDPACYNFRGIWPRADFLSNPRFCPPDHGSLNYCETDIVWERNAFDNGFQMFNYFGDDDYFNAAPTT